MLLGSATLAFLCGSDRLSLSDSSTGQRQHNTAMERLSKQQGSSCEAGPKQLAPAGTTVQPEAL